MTESTIDGRMRPFRVGKSLELLRRSDRFKELLEEVLLWTAVWTGFPAADDLLSKDSSGSDELRGRTPQGLGDRLNVSRDKGRVWRSDATLNGPDPSSQPPVCGYPA
jgi:hypothetical protein